MKKKTILAVLLILVVLGAASSLQAQPEDLKMLSITEDGKYYRCRLDVTDWKPFDDFVYLYSYYFPWRGEDSIDYEIHLAELKVNAEVVGLNLLERSAEEALDKSKILTVQTDIENLTDLKKFPNLVALSLVGISEGDLARLKDCEGLRALDLAYTKISSEDLAYIESLTELRVLNLSYTNVTDEGLKHLASLNNLRSVDLESTEITDEGLTYLEGLEDLRSLNLFRTPAGKVETLVMRGQPYKVGDAGTFSLAKLGNLDELNLHGADLTDEGLKQITKMSKLRLLDLSATKITDASVPDLSKMTNLRYLDVKGTDISVEGLNTLREALPDCEINYCSGSLTKDRRGLLKP
ncbi:hypothetical protein JXM67_12740 [candidate division WOR-3 bacterium]|nr:hypothetical protein [candidate division WOR-3 bacterium]